MIQQQLEFVNLNQTNDNDDIRPFIQFLEPSPKKEKDKYIDPLNGGHNLSINPKTGKWDTYDEPTKEHRKAVFKFLAETYRPKNSNNSFTSDYTTSKHNKQAVTVDSVKVHKKFKSEVYNNRTVSFDHNVTNNDFPYKLQFKVFYKNYEKVTDKISQKAIIPGTNIVESLDKAGIKTKDVLPYYELGYDHLANDKKPERILIVEGQKTARECFNKFDGLLPTISIYGGANINQIPTLVEHLKLIPTLKEIVLSPDFDKKGFEYMMALSKELKKAGCDVEWLLPYPDSYWDRLHNLPDGHESVDMFDYINDFPHLTAQEIIDQIKVISDDEFERMLTGETVTTPSVKSYAVPMDDVMFNDEIGLNWLVPGLIQEGASNMIAAYSNVGKSTLCSQLAIALTQGDNFLGHELAGDKKVLYHTSDEELPDFKERLKSQGYIVPNLNFKLFNKVEGNIWDVTNLDLLDHELTYHDHDVIIIDSLSSIISNTDINENSPEVGKELTKIIKLVCLKHCRTLIIVHHGNRSILNTDRLTLGNVCGHNSIARPLNQIIALREITTESGENVINLKTVKTRSNDKTELMIVRDDEGKFQVTESINVPTINTTEANNSNEKLIIDCLMQSDDWLTRDAIQGHTKLSKGFCNKLLLNLTNTGKVERAKVGKGYQYKINSNLTGSKLSDIYINQEPEPEPIAESIDNSTSQILPLTGSETWEPIEEPIEEPVNNTINVQSEVIDYCPTSDNQDIVDTEKESKRDTKTVNGITFRTGDIYQQFKNSDTLIQIDSFPDGEDYAKCYKVVIDSIGKAIRDSDDSNYYLQLAQETYPYNGHQTSLF